MTFSGSSVKPAFVGEHGMAYQLAPKSERTLNTQPDGAFTL